MYRRLGLALILFISVLALSGARSSNAAVAQTADSTKLQVIRATYDNLLALFYRPPDPSALLNAGWDALKRTAAQSNLPSPPDLSTLPNDKDSAFNAFGTSYRTYVTGLPTSAQPTDLAFAVADAMARSLHEQHTHFLPPSSYQGFLTSLGGGQVSVGLGVSLAPGPPWVVTDVAPGGPAATAGILPGDEIAAADGVDLTSASRQDFSRATGGLQGTTHTITVNRASGRVDLPVTRGEFYFPPLSSRMLPGGIGYIRLDQFADAGLRLPDGSEIISDFDRRLDGLDAEGVRGLIFDLRGNSGGDTFTAAEILSRFLPDNTLTVIRYDERGHRATSPVGGQMRGPQVPMAVLVNQGSASSSEVMASTLRESKRALLVGQRTAGALATSEVLPLPEGAGLQIAVAEQLTSVTGSKIDGVGVPVDVPVADTRTLDDYRAGRDPQLEAAVAALPQAPAPPAFQSSSTGFSSERLSKLLSGYLPDATQIPRNDRLTSVVKTETLNINHPNQWLDIGGFGGRDPLQLQQVVRNRGWLGSHIQNYSLEPLVPPSVGIVIDVYATPEGAAEAVATNDFPDLQEFIAAPVQLGDQTVAYRGTWLGLGSISLSWQRGNVVLNVGYGDVPGNERVDVLVPVAQLLDRLYLQNPIQPASLQSGQSPTEAPIEEHYSLLR